MLKLTFCLHRLPTLSREAFQHYWREHHAPLVRSHASTLRIRRYVQLHSADDDELGAALRQSRGAPESYDGVAELWWDSLEDLGAAIASEAGQHASLALLADERCFIDLARSPLWFGEEHLIL
jgi:uncharacterized protein (TIGR02118 family)